MRILLVVLLVFLTLVQLHAQPWSTFLDPSRAVDWTIAGTGFPIPNYSVPCVVQPVLVPNDVTAGTGNTTAIQNSLASCDATHNVVNITAGTFYVAGITYAPQGSQVIRGAGTMDTTLIMSGQSPCGGQQRGICMVPANPSGNGTARNQPGGATACSWTAGYTKGTTSITLNSCGGPPPVNQILILDQQNDTTDTGGVNICDPSTDNFNMQPRSPACAAPNNNLCSAGCTVGFYEQGNTNLNGRVIGGVSHSQQQVTYITAVSGTGSGPYTVTISPGVSPNNIRASQSPGAWWPGTVTNDGIENLTVIHGLSQVITSSITGFTAGNYLLGATSGSTAYIVGTSVFSMSVLFAAQQGGQFLAGELIQQTATRGGPPTGVSATNSATTNQTGGPTAIAFFNCYQCWIKNIRSENGARSHVSSYWSINDIVRDSYFFGGQSHSTQSYGLEMTSSSNLLIENNIFQQVTNPIIFSNIMGSVADYNLGLFEGFQNADGTPNAFLQTMVFHDAGHALNLWEGNNAVGTWSDIYWGTGSDATVFRSMLRGWQTGKTQATFAVSIGSRNRAFNYIGNVLGQPNYHMHYQSYATSTTGGVNSGPAAGNLSILSLGWSGNSGIAGCFFPPVCDPLVFSTLMRWGNWTSVGPGDTAAQVTWDSTEASPAAVPFVNANFTPAYFATLPHTLPISLHYTSPPVWWPSAKPFPPIGPDVTSGNVGICVGGTYDGAQATAPIQCSNGVLTTAYGSHVNSIPAQDCYLNVMNGPPDGSGPVLNFDSNTCARAASITPPVPPANPFVTSILLPILGGGGSTAAAARFNCATISGCVLWYRGDSTSTSGPQCSGVPCASGGQVTAWLDSSPSADNAGPITASVNCIYQTRALGGHSGVVAGVVANGTPSCGMPISTPLTWNTSYTVFGVVRLQAASAIGSLLAPSAVPSAVPGYRVQGPNNHQQLFRPGLVVLVTGTATLSTGVAYQTNASYNSTTGTGSFRLNRQADGAATVAPVATTGVLNRLLDEGTPNPGAGQFTGTVLEVIVYVPQLSAADITTVETYLNQKYGI